jgi:hypothetical protein
MAQCTAKSKRSGEQCRCTAVIGRSVCYMHGGTTPRGIASPALKHGRHSKHLPARLSALYEEARADPDLLTLADDIALVDTHLARLLEQVSDDDPRILWGKAAVALEQYTETQQRGSREQVTALATLQAVITEGIDGGATGTWHEVLGVLERRRKLVETESKRQQQLQQMIPVEGALLLIGLIERIIKQYVTDHTILAAIGRELSQLATLPPRRIIDVE